MGRAGIKRASSPSFHPDLAGVLKSNQTPASVCLLWSRSCRTIQPICVWKPPCCAFHVCSPRPNGGARPRSARCAELGILAPDERPQGLWAPRSSLAGERVVVMPSRRDGPRRDPRREVRARRLFCELQGRGPFSEGLKGSHNHEMGTLRVRPR